MDMSLTEYINLYMDVGEREKLFLTADNRMLIADSRPIVTSPPEAYLDRNSLPSGRRPYGPEAQNSDQKLSASVISVRDPPFPQFEFLPAFTQFSPPLIPIDDTADILLFMMSRKYHGSGVISIIPAVARGWARLQVSETKDLPPEPSQISHPNPHNP